jgi:hypothetical protein
MASRAARKDPAFDSRFCGFLFNKLKACRLSVLSLATHLGISEQSLFQRRRHDYVWTFQDMVEIAKFFEMSLADFVKESQGEGA